MPITSKIPITDLVQVRDIAQRMDDGMTFNRETAARLIRQMSDELTWRRQVMAVAEETVNAAQRRPT